MDKGGRPSLGGLSLSRQTYPCLVPQCSLSGRTDSLRRHYVSKVAFDKDGSPVLKSSSEYIKLSEEKKRHMDFFRENNFTRTNLPQFKKP